VFCEKKGSSKIETRLTKGNLYLATQYDAKMTTQQNKIYIRSLIHINLRQIEGMLW
jgi:hypothetical protein